MTHLMHVWYCVYLVPRNLHEKPPWWMQHSCRQIIISIYLSMYNISHGCSLAHSDTGASLVKDKMAETLQMESYRD